MNFGIRTSSIVNLINLLRINNNFAVVTDVNSINFYPFSCEHAFDEGTQGDAN